VCVRVCVYETYPRCSQITVTFLSEGAVISDTRILRLKKPRALGRECPWSRRMPRRRYRTKCQEKGATYRQRRGEEIEKERVSYQRDNWRDSNGQSEQGGKKGEIEARIRHPKTGPVIPEIGTWNADPWQELFLLSDFAFVSLIRLSSSFYLCL
jgi:hypothetical protein